MWMSDYGEQKEMTDLQKQLFELQDKKYGDFQSALMPTVDRKAVIGIRQPALRQFAKDFARSGDAESFLAQLPHDYYEENNLHMMLITSIRDYEQCIAEVERFLPYIDNWATCDFAAPKCFSKHKDDLMIHIRKWISSEQTYTIRYGVGMLMRLYLDDDFKPEYLDMAGGIRSEEYYVNMMIAWYFATALSKQWETAVPWIEGKRLPVWVHRKAIQKAVESFRITDDRKAYLKTLR